MVPPDEFIRLAEQTGLIDAIGVFVSWEACQKVIELEAAAGRALRVAVNVSPKQLRNLGSPTWWRRLTAAGIRPDSLAVEITETPCSRSMRSRMRRLNDMGIRSVWTTSARATRRWRR